MIPANAEPLLLAQQGGGYQISRSLRFNAADTPSLSRTVASAGNRKTWTWAGWVKNLNSDGTLFASGFDTNNCTLLRFNSSKLEAMNIANGGATAYKTTSALYRDPGAWMHIVLSVDTTQATATDRIKLYANGAVITVYANDVTPVLNANFEANSDTFYVGQRFASSFLSGYLADIHFIDGQALTPSSFGEFDTNNVWQPKAYTGTYGTNGFRLDFSDNSAATATTLGADRSGNGNNFTPTNLSVTAGIGNDSLTDTPTNYGTDTGLGGEVRGNYCTWNPLAYRTDITTAYSEGNLVASSSSGQTVLGNFGMATGKWYWEVLNSFSASFGITGINDSLSALYTTAGNTGFRYDADANVLEYTTNGTSWTVLATTSVVKPAFIFVSNGTSSNSFYLNTGQRPFTYTAPTGYKCLCSTNLPTPTIANGATAMDAVLYTGTGATLTPTSSLGFSPDLVWIKSRSAATDHTLYDVVRGAQARLESNTTDAEVTTDGGLTAFNSNGFTLGTLAQVNTNTDTYAAWCWDGGTSTVTNTTGTTSSQVRANASAGISIVSYTGTGANGTVGHGLGVAPQLVIVKQRTDANDWYVWHQSLLASQLLLLNSTNLPATNATWWNNTAPSGTVFSLGTGGSNTSTKNYIAYCFAPVSGFSAFGSYTGNSNADGQFVYTGFRPRWILIKRTSGSISPWLVFDSSRLGYNVGNQYFIPNAPDVEFGDLPIDLLSNGFKLRAISSGFNASSTYIYAAFAEHPFSLARAR